MIQLPDTIKLEKVNKDDFQTLISYDMLKLYAVQAGIFKGYKWFIWHMSKDSSQCYVNGELQPSHDSFHIYIEYKVKGVPYLEYREYLADYMWENNLEIDDIFVEGNNLHWLDGTQFNHLKGLLFDTTFEEARNTIFKWINLFKDLADQNLILQRR